MNNTNSNPILTQLPRAQEAFNDSAATLASLDTTDLILQANQRIRDACAKGLMVCAVGQSSNIPLVEKAAMELSELGYHCTTTQTGVAPQPDGSSMPLCGIMVNWRYLPANTRDGYTV